MAVPKYKRGESKFEVLIHAVKLRREFTLLLLRDFGVKTKIRDYKAWRQSLINRYDCYKKIQHIDNFYRRNIYEI